MVLIFHEPIWYDWSKNFSCYICSCSGCISMASTSHEHIWDGSSNHSSGKRSSHNEVGKDTGMVSIFHEHCWHGSSNYFFDYMQNCRDYSEMVSIFREHFWYGPSNHTSEKNASCNEDMGMVGARPFLMEQSVSLLVSQWYWSVYDVTMYDS